MFGSFACDPASEFDFVLGPPATPASAAAADIASPADKQIPDSVSSGKTYPPTPASYPEPEALATQTGSPHDARSSAEENSRPAPAARARPLPPIRLPPETLPGSAPIPASILHP